MDDKKTDVGVTQDNKASEKAAAKAVADRKKDGKLERQKGAGDQDEAEMTNSEKMTPFRDPATAGKRDIGDREAVPAGDLDVLYTNESKARWDDGQPEFGDLLKQSNAIDKQIAEREENR